MQTFRQKIFNEYLEDDYLPISDLIRDRREWENHTHEIRQQLIAENQCENTLYVVEE